MTKIHFVTCHKKPERSFFYKGKQFPICARCTGLYLGFVLLPFFLFGFLRFNIYLSMALILPTLIDGLTQAYFNRESNNLLRFITGVIAGLGCMSLTSILGNYIGYLIFD